MNIEAQNIYIRDYDYGLPQGKIAEFPLPDRSASKLLIYKDGHIKEDLFHHIPGYIEPGTTMFLNNTRVIEARIHFQKPTGGVIEIFCLEPNGMVIEKSLATQQSVIWQCLIGGASKWKHGQVLKKTVTVNDMPVVLSATYTEKQSDHFLIRFQWDPSQFSFADILHVAGAIPLPPYIKRAPTVQDQERYQTIFSSENGSVAAPTAALHFTKKVLSELEEKKVNCEYLTLHVGAGTFKPVKTETVGDHEMHQEPFSVSYHALKNILHAKEVIAVGTTSLRTLETLYWLGVKLLHGKIHDIWTLSQWEAYALEKEFPGISTAQSIQALITWMEQMHADTLHCGTSLLIVPGYNFRIPAGLITNFHQPQSTLLLLVSAFVGEDWKRIYQYAVEHDFRFLSYGDSSLLFRREFSY